MELGRSCSLRQKNTLAVLARQLSEVKWKRGASKDYCIENYINDPKRFQKTCKRKYRLPEAVGGLRVPYRGHQHSGADT